MRRAVKRVGIGTSAVFVGLGLYLFVHDCLILVHIVQPYGDGPAGLIMGPILIVIGAVTMLWLLERPLFPN
jgi:hypothetical protein